MFRRGSWSVKQKEEASIRCCVLLGDHINYVKQGVPQPIGIVQCFTVNEFFRFKTFEIVFLTGNVSAKSNFKAKEVDIFPV